MGSVKNAKLNPTLHASKPIVFSSEICLTSKSHSSLIAPQSLRVFQYWQVVRVAGAMNRPDLIFLRTHIEEDVARIASYHKQLAHGVMVKEIDSYRTSEAMISKEANVEAVGDQQGLELTQAKSRWK